MNTISPSRALVLAGAGAAGNAWQLGLVAGLSATGVDLTNADLTIGTSAGSTAAAQITGSTPPDELYAAMLAEVPPSDRSRTVAVSGNYMQWSQAIIDGSKDAAEMRRRMGAAALERDDDEGLERVFTAARRGHRRRALGLALASLSKRPELSEAIMLKHGKAIGEYWSKSYEEAKAVF